MSLGDLALWTQFRKAFQLLSGLRLTVNLIFSVHKLGTLRVQTSKYITLNIVSTDCKISKNSTVKVEYLTFYFFNLNRSPFYYRGPLEGELRKIHYSFVADISS